MGKRKQYVSNTRFTPSPLLSLTSFSSFSKGLVLEYWNSQPYTLQAFRSGTHESAKTLVEGLQTPRKEGSPSVSSQKRRPTPSTVMLEIEKKQKIEDIRQAQITAEPPKGLTWKDIASVHNVFHCGKSTFFAEVRWIKLDTVSYVPTRIIRKNNPLKVRGGRALDEEREDY